MHRLFIGILIVGIIILLYLLFTRKVTAETFNSKINSVPTLQDLLNQKDSLLTTSVSTNGLLGFADPNPPADPNSFVPNVLTRDLLDEQLIRNLFNSRQNQIQVNTETGTGAGVNTKTVDPSVLQNIPGFTPEQQNNFVQRVVAGGLKVVQDPTSGLTSIALTQETINRAKSDPQLAAALVSAQNRFLSKQLGIIGA